MTFVSIVIPVYNRARYLETAIESVIWQTDKNWELIISDDGSTDGSLEIAQNFAERDPRIRVLTNPNRPADDANRGAANALIAGFSAARGEYIGQLDSDDLLEQQAIELTVAALDNNPDWGLVYTNYVDIDANGQKMRPGWRCSIPYSKERILSVFMAFHFRMMRKSAYLEIGGFRTEFDTIEDYDICLRLSEITEIGKINEYLYQYRKHENSVTGDKLAIDFFVLIQSAIQEALDRRGMKETHRIKVKFNPTFAIVPIL